LYKITVEPVPPLEPHFQCSEQLDFSKWSPGKKILICPKGKSEILGISEEDGWLSPATVSRRIPHACNKTNKGRQPDP
jgi:hypothetical protein